MTKKIFVYKKNDTPAIIKQVSIKRDWMDETHNKHAYQCMPISLANTLGWSISFPIDISFIWDGICDTSSDHVKIIKGKKYCSPVRGNATVSFNTYLNFKTDIDVTTLIMPVPNLFNENAQCFTTLISTSFYQSELPVAWRVLKPHTEITILANTPVAVFIPLSLSNLENFEVDIKTDKSLNFERQKDLKFIEETNKNFKFSGLYRKAENYIGNSIGKHELMNLKLKTVEKNEQ